TRLGCAAATSDVELHKREAGPRHGILQERDRRPPRQAMLAAQMQKSADKAAAAVSVIITAARPVAVVGKMLEHQVEQLHRLCDFRFPHWFDRSRSGVRPGAYHRPPQSAAPLPHGRLIGSTKAGSLFLTFPTRGLTGHATISS